MSTIRDIENKNIINSEVIIRQLSNNKNIVDKITRAHLNTYNVNIVHEIDTGFDFMNMFIGDYYEDGDIQRQYVKFETVFNTFDERLIPYISTIIIYEQFGDNVPTSYFGDSAMLYNPREFFSGLREADYSQLANSSLVEVEDIQNSNLKKVKIASVCHIYNSFAVLPQFRTKFLVSLYNPNNFLRID